MRYRFVVSEAAKEDLKDIGRYTQNRWGKEQRVRYNNLLFACFHQLARNPMKGIDCSHIRLGYRKFNVGSHIVFYRVIEPGIIAIVRILHNRMDVEKHLLMQ